MTNRNYYRTETYIHNDTFGGIIYLSDFNTNYHGKSAGKEGSSIAARIVGDMKFDKKCRENIKKIERERKNG